VLERGGGVDTLLGELRAFRFTAGGEHCRRRGRRRRRLGEQDRLEFSEACPQANCFRRNVRYACGVNLNTLRGPIAHCSELAQDEEIRLRLSVRDWFRQLAAKPT